MQVLWYLDTIKRWFQDTTKTIPFVRLYKSGSGRCQDSEYSPDFDGVNPDTMVGDYINTLKTTFDFSLSLYQAVKQHGYT